MIKIVHISDFYYSEATKQKVMMTKYTEFVRKFFPRRTKRTGRLISGTLKGALKVIRIATGNIGGSWLHAFPILKSGS